jgi:hypothetical protein
MASVTRIHRIVASISALLPVFPAVTGGGSLAFTMYAQSVEFRLEITARDASGRTRFIAPSALAARVPASVVPFFAGSDHFRRTYGDPPLAHRLGEVARLACVTDERRAASVEVALFERRRMNVREIREQAPCNE